MIDKIMISCPIFNGRSETLRARKVYLPPYQIAVGKLYFTAQTDTVHSS